MKCPICKKEFKGDYRDKFYPFDKEQCQLIDLYGWICDGEEYVISTPISMSQDDEE